MTNSVQSIALDKLVAHPDNPNRMSKANFAKLVRNIKLSGRYEPLIVRPIRRLSLVARDSGHEALVTGYGPRDCFQIINGHHRYNALAHLGYKQADAIVWDVDDEQADILLATLNRLSGSDELDKKLKLLKRLNKKTEAGQLAKLLPQTAKQIERLVNLRRLTVPAKIDAKSFATPLVFFVSDSQQQIIENALSRAERLTAVLRTPYGEDAEEKGKSKKNGHRGHREHREKIEINAEEKGKTKAAKRAAALTCIAQYFVSNSKFNSRT